MAGSIYEELGVQPIVNALGHYTMLGGSTPSPRVREAMERAGQSYVEMEALLRRSGEIIAGLLGAEAAYVTSGAAAALALGAAACITGADREKMARIPDTAGMRNRVVVQKAQRYHYDRAVTIVGARLVEVGDAEGASAEQLAAALDADTAAVLYPAHLEGEAGTLSLAEVIEVAHGKGVPVLVDAAGQVYPLERFLGYPRTGADLVCYGAKYIGAPQSAGILCGRSDLVEAAALQGFIGFETAAYGLGFGRPLKLDRQTIVGVVVALQEWLALDHERRLAELERKLELIASRLEGIEGVTAEHVRGYGTEALRLRLRIDPRAARRTAEEVEHGLRAGAPPISVGAEPGALLLNPATLHDGEETLVAERLRALLA